MISYFTGDIFDSTAQALVNPVNCIGVMGAGLAKAFKTRFPLNFEYYKAHCKNHKLKLGFVLPFREGDRVIINFPTKNHWKDKSNHLDIIAGIIDMGKRLEQQKTIKSVALPKLGCGLGGLKWEELKYEILPFLAMFNETEWHIYE